MSGEGLPFKVEHTGRNVLTMRCKVSAPPSEWEQWILLRSDAHHDNPKCDWALEKRHLDEAKERGAGIIDLGDLFCMMQGKYDRRHTKAAVRPEHQVDDYLDAVIRTAADFYEPYADNFLVIGRGNHECSVEKRHEIRPIERLVATLNDRTKAQIQAGGYTGWVRFFFTKGKTEHTSRVLWYTHGYGGGGPVTQDMIQSNRQRVYIENADIMASGHSHDAWANETTKLKLNVSGEVVQRPLWYIKCPTYKDDYGSGFSGWHVDTGKPPKPKGAWWLRFWWDGRRGLQMQVLRAS